MEQLIAMALRKPIYTGRDSDGRRIKSYPSEEDSRFALKLLVERLEPTLQSVAAQVDQTVRNHEPVGASDPRRLARALLNVFGRSIRIEVGSDAPPQRAMVLLTMASVDSRPKKFRSVTICQRQRLDQPLGQKYHLGSQSSDVEATVVCIGTASIQLTEMFGQRR